MGRFLAKLLMGAGVAILGGLILGIPYVFYVGVRFGWLDERIAWAPLGVPGALLALLLFHVGSFMYAKVGRPHGPN